METSLDTKDTRDIDNPTCSVCSKKVKKRKLFLPIRNKKYMNREESCLCEDCFFRLPDDIHRDLISNASQQSGVDFNTMVIDALNHSSIRNLNDDYIALVSAYERVGFYRFGSRKELKQALKDYAVSGASAIGFENGKKI